MTVGGAPGDNDVFAAPMPGSAKALTRIRRHHPLSASAVNAAAAEGGSGSVAEIAGGIPQANSSIAGTSLVNNGGRPDSARLVGFTTREYQSWMWPRPSRTVARDA